MFYAPLLTSSACPSAVEEMIDRAFVEQDGTLQDAVMVLPRCCVVRFGALVMLLSLCVAAVDLVRRWFNEVASAGGDQHVHVTTKQGTSSARSCHEGRRLLRRMSLPWCDHTTCVRRTHRLGADLFVLSTALTCRSTRQNWRTLLAASMLFVGLQCLCLLLVHLVCSRGVGRPRCLSRMLQRCKRSSVPRWRSQIPHACMP